MLSVDQCKFMDSKMRPLYLVFENTDELGDLVRIIFKNGDGECESTEPRTSVAVPTR